jgi:hypothetical protein
VKRKSWKSRLKDWLINIFRRNPCYKLIAYQGTVWKLSLSADAAKVVTVNLKELTKQVQEITPATNHAIILDDYQYLMCRDIERWKDDKEYVKLLRGYRISITAYIIRLAEILEQIKVDIANVELKQELIRISRKMSDLIDSLANSLSRG